MDKELTLISAQASVRIIKGCMPDACSNPEEIVVGPKYSKNKVVDLNKSKLTLEKGQTCPINQRINLKQLQNLKQRVSKSNSLLTTHIDLLEYWSTPCDKHCI